MGVFSERVFAVLFVLPWRLIAAAGDSDRETRGTTREGPEAIPTVMTGSGLAPSSWVLRPDLEAMRRRP